LIDPLLECDQVAGDEFTAGAVEFVGKADIEKFRQPFVGIKADPVPIGNRDQHEVEQLLQASQSLVESLAEESMVDPTEGTADGSNAIRPRRLRSFGHHAARVFVGGLAGYRNLWNLQRDFLSKLVLANSYQNITTCVTYMGNFDVTRLKTYR
jgi:hypothetical protein